MLRKKRNRKTFMATTKPNGSPFLSCSQWESALIT